MRPIPFSGLVVINRNRLNHAEQTALDNLKSVDGEGLRTAVSVEGVQTFWIEEKRPIAANDDPIANRSRTAPKIWEIIHPAIMRHVTRTGAPLTEARDKDGIRHLAYEGLLAEDTMFFHDPRNGEARAQKRKQRFTNVVLSTPSKEAVAEIPEQLLR